MDMVIKRVETEAQVILLELLQAEDMEKEIIKNFISQYGIPKFIEQYDTLPISMNAKKRINSLLSVLGHLGGSE